MKPPRFLAPKKDRTLRIFIGLFFVFIVASLLFIEKGPIAKGVSTFENLGYDLQVRQMHKPLQKHTPIVIVDIDDKSLDEKGRWPWPRKILAELITKLYNQGAAVVAIDMIFPDPEKNIAEEVFRAVPNKTPEDFNAIKEQFDYDRLFASSLQLGPSVLGIVFLDDAQKVGKLPPPLLQMSSQLLSQIDIPKKEGYLANIAQLTQKAKNEGFINASPDPEGVLRFTPLLLQHEGALYGSLSLAAAIQYTQPKKIQLITANYSHATVLEGIQLDKLFIPTDPTGKILIPFRGPPYSFPYVSAKDVLNNTAPNQIFKDKLIFIGCSASAIGDIVATSISPTFSGVEVQASVAAGIIDDYLPFKPAWGRGVTLLLILGLGLICAVALPFFNIASLCVLALSLPLCLIFANYWIWSSLGLVLSMVLPIALIFLLFILNLVWGYLFETSFANTMKSIFGQYVPPVYLDEMIERGAEFSLEGTSKELSLLFADIRNFTNLSEKMGPAELKNLLNRYFNPMTKMIFKHKGTIDKYVGDMVMAFWGAPLNDPYHALNAVSAAFAMQESLIQLNETFQKEGKPRLQTGIGINTGIVNVGDMGSQFRRAYTAIGDAVNLASRLEGQTKYYHVDILVGENTYQQTKNDFLYRKIDKIKVKGKDRVVEVFEPLMPASQATDSMNEQVLLHTKALDAYFEKKWDEATTLFQKLRPSRPDLYDLYLTRIATFRTNPPPPDWDGSFISLEK